MFKTTNEAASAARPPMTTQPDLTRVSKFLSLVLRHQPQSIGLPLDPAGWAAVDELLRLSAAARQPITQIRLGHDTDTTACIAGGIAGLRFGLSGIPERWRLGLQGREVVEPLLQALLARRAAPGRPVDGHAASRG